ADLYQYHFAPRGAQAHWTRERQRAYLPILRAADPQLQRVIEGFGWKLLAADDCDCACDDPNGRDVLAATDR
ncbi:MAG: hypothetical protein VX656_06490, partial [Candidatus Latescibacterota bacterium]|nr:hypothetical protein [Candidatus Latescibacterota bacterium]